MAPPYKSFALLLSKVEFIMVRLPEKLPTAPPEFAAVLPERVELVTNRTASFQMAPPFALAVLLERVEPKRLSVPPPPLKMAP